jgi:hypothetical protein
VLIAPHSYVRILSHTHPQALFAPLLPFSLPFSRTCREEFKRHKKADPKWLGSFFREWESYLKTIESQSAAAEAGVGRNLGPEEVAALNEEQQLQLAQLQKEAVNMAKET